MAITSKPARAAIERGDTARGGNRKNIQILTDLVIALEAKVITQVVKNTGGVAQPR